MEKNNINLVPQGAAPIYHAAQNDNGRVIGCVLYDLADAFELDGSETLSLRYRKPSGDFGNVGIENNGGTEVEISLPTAVTDEPGLVFCKVHVNGIGAKAFYIKVQREV